MSNQIRVVVDGEEVTVPLGVSVAAAILNAGRSGFRKSVSGEPRGPVCGMGICYECRALVNGTVHVRTCMTMCEEGMVIATDV